MRAVIQRVNRATVVADGELTGSIGKGLFILLGVEAGEDPTKTDDLDWLAQKIVGQRIFSDEQGQMNLSLKDVDAEILVVSQFTLFAKTRKGNRPSFIDAARPETAVPLYEAFVKKLSELTGKEVPTGRFGADMKIDMEADGPVTIIMDTRRREEF